MDPTGLPPPNYRFGLMPPTPHGVGGAAGGHRRAHSETFLHMANDILLDSDPDFCISDIDFPSFSDDSLSAGDAIAGCGGPPAVDSRRSDPPAVELGRAGRPAGGAHLRSLSVDAAFFEGLTLQGALTSAAAGRGSGGEGMKDRRGLHRRSGSMDGASSPFEGQSASSSSDYAKKTMAADKLAELAGLDYPKKAMAADKLAELALIDPRRAKRILANRQSAARSKERKIRYTSELERKVQTLQTEATTLSAQLTLLQKDTTGLTAENRELKMRLQAMEQQAKLRGALNAALREEVQRLKIATEQLPNINGNCFGEGLQQALPSYFSQSQQLPHLGGHQPQHHHQSPSQSSNSPSVSSPSISDSMDFM